MTKREYREAHRLTDREKAQIWNEISEPYEKRRRRRYWIPALSGMAAAACALAVILILSADDGRGPAPEHLDVAVVPSEQPVAAPPAAGESDHVQSREIPRAVQPGPSKSRSFVAEKDGETTRTAEVVVTSEARAGSGEGVLRGIVRDAETGKPLVSANVILKGTTRGAVSDDRGRFEFHGLKPGRYTVQILYLGYRPTEEFFAIAGSDTAEVQVALAMTIIETLGAPDPASDQTVTETPDIVAMDLMDAPSGVLARPDKMTVRGGREGEVQMLTDGVVSRRAGGGSVNSPAPTVGAESGGTRNPNDRPYDLVYHEHYGVNPFVATEDDALSTFAIEVDDASWTVARRYLTDGHLPPAEAIRVEEIVNRLDAGFDRIEGDDFSLHADGAPSRFGVGYHLLRVGVQARDIPAVDRRPAHLVFVIDISGSMDRENRLGLVKRSLRVLVNELNDDDRVGIVVYGSEASVLLEPTGVADRGTILNAIDGLRSGGSTNAEAGLRMAYAMAREHAAPGAINRLILCSDGVANMGNTGADSILDSVREEADQGASLTTIGFGMGNYNDVLMEQLANDGDGTYHYVQRLEDAERVFRLNLTGTLQTVGAEVKTQVEFDPASVTRWRLLGYENRDVADRDFRNDSIDAGEIGAGHTAVALYEIKLTEDAARDLESGRARDLGTLRLRWAKPRYHDEADTVTEIDRALSTRDLARTWDDAAPRLRAAAVAAEFAEILRKSYWAKESSLADLQDPVTRLVSELAADPDVIELSQLIRRAAALAPAASDD